MAVVRGLGAAVLEHDHRAHRVGAHGVADVVALDASGRTRKSEPLGEIDEQRLGALGVEVVHDAALPQRARRGRARLFDELPARAAPGMAEIDWTTALLGEELLDHGRILDGVGDQDGAGHRRCAAVVLRHERPQAVTGAARSVTPSSSWVSMAMTRPRRTDSSATMARPPSSATATQSWSAREPVSIFCRSAIRCVARNRSRKRAASSKSSLRGVLHLPAQLRVQDVAAALHEEVDLVEQGGVLDGVDASLAGTAAALDVVVETHPAAPEDIVAAGAERKDGAQ